MEHQLNTANEKSLKIGPKVHKGQTKFMTNVDTTDNKRDRNREGD